MKCPTCGDQTLGVNRNDRGIYCDQCGAFLENVTEVEKPKPVAKPKAPAKKTK